MTTPRRPRHPTTTQTGYLNPTDIAAIMGWTRTDTVRFLWRWRAALSLPRPRRIGDHSPLNYPAVVIEEIRNLLGQPANLPDPNRDWLARFQEGTHGTDPERDR